MRHVAGLLATVLLPAVACTTSVAVDPEGRPCSPSMPCGPGTVCDPVTSTCVASPAVDGLLPADTAPKDTGIEDQRTDTGPAPDQTVPDSAITPDQTIPDTAIPPDQTVPDKSVPDKSVPDTAVTPDQAVPDQAVPDTAITPDQSVQDSGIPPQVVSAGPNLHQSIADGAYQGTLQSMRCVSLNLADVGLTSVQLVHVTVGISHPYLGDLVIKVQDPGGLITTVLSRPGVDEPVDDRYTTNGDSSNLSGSHPITFRDDSVNDAEQMGSTIGSSATVCKDDSICDYAPNPGAGPGTNLADFIGRNPVGTWQICVGDGYGGDSGWLESVTLTVTSL